MHNIFSSIPFGILNISEIPTFVTSVLVNIKLNHSNHLLSEDYLIELPRSGGIF
jgi:hypothetical protein